MTTQSPWTLISDSMPDLRTMVLLCDDFGNIDLGWWMIRKGEVAWDDDNGNRLRPTWWAALPGLPEGVKRT